MSWELRTTRDFERTSKQIAKKSPAGFSQAFSNLRHVEDKLNIGCSVNDILKSGHVHPAQKGIFGVDEKGKQKSQPLRLYVWPDKDNKILYLLRFTEKDQQSQAIQDCINDIHQLQEGEI